MLTLLATAVFAQTPPAPAPPAAPAGPTVAPCTVFAPTYTIDGQNPPQAGSMFAVKVGEKTVLVTSFSIFGPGGGLSAQLPAAKLGEHVTAVTAKDAFDATVCGKSTKALPLPDAVPFGQGHDMTKDIAVFDLAPADYNAQANAVPIATLAFAAKAPKVGDKVWLLASLKGQTAKAFPAKVVQSDAGYVFFQLDDGTLDLAGTPGAPVVDATGALIGVDVAGQKMQDGALIGGATPLATTKSRIETAAK
jgi:hypothetical protein